MTVHNVYAFAWGNNGSWSKTSCHCFSQRKALGCHAHTNTNISARVKADNDQNSEATAGAEAAAWAIKGHHIILNDSFNFPLGLIKYIVIVITGHHRP